MERKRTVSAAEIERIVETYSDMILRIALHQVNSYSEAEDILQTVFLRLMKSGQSFENNEHEKAWLIRVTVNLCKDYLKSASYQRATPMEQLPEHVNHDRNRDEDSRLNRMELLSAVKTLPPNYRDAIYLHYYESMSVSRIAKVLAAKDGTVMSWLHRGRALLRSALEGGFDHEY